ncbi:flagellar biosynthesis protein FliO [Undibacter mobilis]|uniref:Flagellar biosynthesis protein FliO n=2 Tax=Undibacter mobilis TaxID=2292256 RepID=A0A371BE08_9BRAD|nr:flagellar biosynthesis protein FliO [Undibacter mobilis]
MPTAAKFFVAFAAVLALIGLTAWLVRRFAADRLGGANARGRQPRLAVIDAATVDARRRLVLIRRDNVEHLMMIGGPTDVVVEQNIVRAAPAAPRAPETVTRAAEPALRHAPAPDNVPLQPITESAPLPPPRPYRQPVTEEPWHAPEPGARPRPASSENSLSGLAAELSSRIAPPDVMPTRAAAPQMTPQPVAPPVAPPVAMEHEPGEAPQTDHNLAEMAQQLEAALRRAPAESRAPVTDPLAVPVASKSVSPLPVEVPRRDYKLRVDPRIEAPAPAKSADDGWPEPPFEMPRPSRQEPRLDRPTSQPPRSTTPAGKTVYDSLEQEMASLLGRPPGKT